MIASSRTFGGSNYNYMHAIVYNKNPFLLNILFVAVTVFVCVTQGNHVSCAGRTVHYRVTACVKSLNAKFERMRNVKAQIPKLELQDVCFRPKSQNVLWRNFPVLRYNLQHISKEHRYCQYLCIA